MASTQNPDPAPPSAAWLQWAFQGAQGRPPRPNPSTPAVAWAYVVIELVTRGLYNIQRRLERKALRAAQRAQDSSQSLEEAAGPIWLRSRRISDRLDLFISFFFSLSEADWTQGGPSRGDEPVGAG